MARPPATRAAAAKAVQAKAKGGPMNAQGQRASAAADGPNSKKATAMVAVGIMVVLAIFERPVCILLMFALVPTVIAWLVDHTPNQALIRTVAPLNIASVLPFALKLWHENNSLDQVFAFMSGGATWVALYGAAAFGWLLYYLAPALITSVLERRIEKLRDTASERQKALKDEWGDDVER